MTADPRVTPLAAQLDRHQARKRLDDAVAAVTTVLRGNEEAVRLLVAAVVARGHVLIEDVPGVGKTILARAVARVTGCSFSRVQFTADMLPADVLGVHVLDPDTGGFLFKKGPIFAHIVLADEINRASPKTQSAMLEAMSDRQVTVDETTATLPDVFTVLATQNPVEHHGAYPLPESQLDRFMVRLAIGYPPAADERDLILAPQEPATNLDRLGPVLTSGDVRAMQRFAESVELSEPVADYLLSLVEATRNHPDVLLGCSPRGSVQFASIARAWAFTRGRDYVLPDDIKHLAPPVLMHRIVVSGGLSATGVRVEARMVVEDIVASTPVPR
jgi:MoxR-like ATPase